ncbi:hypothetical protein ACWOFR_09140 [Carnobacterium gallinarum]|uniref:hypothetical protein n=1 Tax=Carnobacterium gallinarum TaxID=2749 RepID=UPI0005593A5C|nr:hypothetical protein [Carnobacterium gallinarum]
MSEKYNVKAKKSTYRAFGKFFNTLKSKEALAFQLTQMVKMEDRKGVLDLLEQVYLANKRAEQKKENGKQFSLPADLPADILYSSTKEFAYVMGYFIIGLLSYSTENKEGNEAE